MEMLTQKQKFIVIIVIILVIGVVAYYYINSTKEVYTGFEEENIVELEETKDTENKEETEDKIIVHITGAVKNNGIVEVKEKARINDVVEAAGGLTEDADLDNVNLAYIVEDGQKIYIPSKNDKESTKSQDEENEKNNSNESTTSAKNTETKSAAQKNAEAKNIINEIITNLPEGMVIEGVQVLNGPININKATASELKVLPGIGESTANKIIEYRNKNGKFKTIEDLKNVSGIGDAKFNAIKDLICV